MGSNKLKLVAVHLGVSNSVGNSQELSDFAKSICKEVMQDDGEGQRNLRVRCTNNDCSRHFDGPHMQSTAERAVVRLVELMENNHLLNCAYGSNLNMDGHVECDASIMRGRDGAFAGVGAIRGCSNPIRLVESIISHRSLKMPLGLVPLNVLVGSSGGKRWMRNHCANLIVHESKMIAKKPFEQFQKYKSLHDDSLKQSMVCSNEQKLSQNHQDNPMFRLDTVGAIAVDENDEIACATSSGGISLKHQGRLGQAAMPGAGCWAQPFVASTTSGVGELLTASLFAKRTCDYVGDLVASQKKSYDDLTDCISTYLGQSITELLNSKQAEYLDECLRRIGALVVINSQAEGYCYLSTGHNANSMCVAYMASCDGEPHCIEHEDESDKLTCPGIIKLKTKRVYYSN